MRSFDFLGYTFQAPGSSRWSGRDVQPSSCPRSAPVPASVWVPRCGPGGCTRARAGHTHSLADLARRINPIVRGWIGWGLPPQALYPLLKRINAYLVRWPHSTNGCGLSRRPKRPGGGSPDSTPCLMAHWAWVHSLLVTRKRGKSRVTGHCYPRFCCRAPGGENPSGPPDQPPGLRRNGGEPAAPSSPVAKKADIQLLQMSPVGGRAGSPGYYSGPESRGLTVGIKKK